MTWVPALSDMIAGYTVCPKYFSLWTTAEVDVTSADAMTRTYAGVSDRRTQRTSSCPRLSMGPQEIDGAAARGAWAEPTFERN